MHCPFCGHAIPFIYNESTKEQRDSFWCGDNGGHYEYNHDCTVTLRDKKLETILGTMSHYKP